MAAGDCLYAVAVRDGSDLFLVFDICRRGDNVYVNFPRDHELQWKPHSSYHASGQRHQKSFNQQLLRDKGQQPNANFCGTENIVNIGIERTDPRAINKPCQPTDFDQIFEIPIDDVGDKRYRTYLSVDLVELGQSVPFVSQAKTIRQMSFQDRTPSIVVTLYELQLMPTT